MDISNINAEILNLHPNTHEFWEDENIKKEFLKFLGLFAKNKKAYNKLTTKEQKEKTANYLRGDFDDVEVGFVDGLFELYKLRELITKYKTEIISMRVISAIKHRDGT